LTPLTEANLEALLTVQAHDTEVDRCRHRRATLPERSGLAAVDAELAALEPRLATARGERDVVAERQRDLEQHLATVEHRAVEVKRRLYGGTVSATRELQAMAAEVDSLTARASDLESQALEAMDELEPLDGRVGEIEAEKASLLEARAAVAARLAAREGEVDTEIETVNKARAEAAADLPTDLVATYERLRQRLGGVGAARLVGGRCDGCHLTLPATELDQLRRQPPGTLTFCDQCGRILVSTRS
jgi:predicted  nucleic acid-binding Zn-ribbon protein